MLFGAQVYYYVFRYAKVLTFRGKKNKKQKKCLPVSVIVPIYNTSFYYIEEVLPKIFNQTLEQFEVIIINLTGDEDFAEQLKVIKENNPRFNYIQIRPDQSYKVNTKLALNLGIKAAQYEHFIFSTVDCEPSSERWLELMSEGFADSDVVLGYCGMKSQKGVQNKIIRCDRVAHSLRWLSEAALGNPYRGILGNLGFSKSIYFEAKGFNHLNLNAGEDDLFIMKIATPKNTNIVATAMATTTQQYHGELGWWIEQRIELSDTYRFYSGKVKLLITAELWSRMLFFFAIIAMLIFAPLCGKMLALTLFVLRLAMVMVEMKLVCKRLGESNLLSAYPIYELCSPFIEAWSAILRFFIPSRKWR